jgi:hypothetical protein
MWKGLHQVKQNEVNKHVIQSMQIFLAAKHYAQIFISHTL